MTFNSGSTADPCQRCKPVFVPSARKAPIYKVDLAVKSPAETHFQQRCIFLDPQSKLVSETNWNNWSKLIQCSFAVEIYRQKHFLIAKTAAKTVKERPQGLSLRWQHCGHYQIYTNIWATRVKRPLWSTRYKIINLRYTRNQGIAVKPG